MRVATLDATPPAPAQADLSRRTEEPELQLYDALYRAILGRRLAPATRLDKATLGHLFGLSSAAVQRALNRLALDGAVELPANEAARVMRPSAGSVCELLQARLPVEAQIIHLAAPRLGQAQFDALHGMVERQRGCLAQDDHAGLIDAATDVHLYLSRHAGNAWLHEFLTKLLRQSALNIALNRVRAYNATTCDEHQRFVERLAAGDSVSAQALLEQHLRDLFARLRFTPPPTEDLWSAFQGKLPAIGSREISL